MNILLEKTNFIYYTNTYFKQRQGLEIFNLYVKDMDTYILYTNLKNPENIYKLNNMLNVFRKAKSIISNPFTLIVVDNDKVKILFLLFNNLIF